MVSEDNFGDSEFFKSFFKYIENGTLPKSFQSKEDLWKHIRTILTSAQRRRLFNQYNYQFNSRSSHNYGPALSPDLEPVNALIPRAFVEGITGSAIIGAATYVSTSDAYTAFKSAAVGLLWMFGRCAKKGRDQADVCAFYADRFNECKITLEDIVISPTPKLSEQTSFSKSKSLAEILRKNRVQ